MVVYGDFSNMMLPDALSMLRRKAATGVLSCQRNNVLKQITLFAGSVVAATSNQPEERIGRHLIRRGLLTEEQFHKTLRAQAGLGAKFGELLLRTGELDAMSLADELSKQAENLLCGTFSWTSGQFHFEERPLEIAPSHPVWLEIDDLIFRGILNEGIPLADEIQEDSEVIKSSRATLSAAPLNAEVILLLQKLDTHRSVAQLQSQISLSKERLRRLLAALDVLGIIELPVRGDKPVCIADIVGFYRTAFRTIFLHADTRTGTEGLLAFWESWRKTIASTASDHSEEVHALRVSVGLGTLPNKRPEIEIDPEGGLQILEAKIWNSQTDPRAIEALRSFLESAILQILTGFRKSFGIDYLTSMTKNLELCAELILKRNAKLEEIVLPRWARLLEMAFQAGSTAQHPIEEPTPLPDPIPKAAALDSPASPWKPTDRLSPLVPEENDGSTMNRPKGKSPEEKEEPISENRMDHQAFGSWMDLIEASETAINAPPTKSDEVRDPAKPQWERPILVHDLESLAVQERKRRAEALFKEGLLEASLHHYAEAADTWKACLSVDPDYPEAAQRLKEAREKTRESQDLEKALAKCQSMLEKDHLTEMLRIAADILHKDPHNSSVPKLLTKAQAKLSIDPGKFKEPGFSGPNAAKELENLRIAALLAAAGDEMAESRLEAAKLHFEEVLRLEPGNETATKELEETEKRLETEAKIGQLLGNAYFFQQQQKLQESCGALEEVLALDPERPGVLELFQHVQASISDLPYKAVGGGRCKPYLRRDLANLKDYPLTADESFLLTQIDGATDIRSLAVITGLGKPATSRILLSLAKRGLIALPTPRKK